MEKTKQKQSSARESFRSLKDRLLAVLWLHSLGNKYKRLQRLQKSINGPNRTSKVIAYRTTLFDIIGTTFHAEERLVSHDTKVDQLTVLCDIAGREFLFCWVLRNITQEERSLFASALLVRSRKTDEFVRLCLDLANSTN